MSFLKKLQKFLLDILFPIECLGCGQEGKHLCETCLSHIPLRAEQHCAQCNIRPTRFGEPCAKCIGTTALDGLLVATHYRHSLVPRAIHLYKYRFVSALHEPLAELLVRHIQAADIPLPDVILPVPLHPRRLRWRGFNQAELLAHHLQSRLTPNFPLPVIENHLRRIRFTRAQMQQEDAVARRKNLAGAFVWQSDADNVAPTLAGKRVWLVDDVVATSSTLDECAKVLKQVGARSVYGIAIAR